MLWWHLSLRFLAQMWTSNCCHGSVFPGKKDLLHVGFLWLLPEAAVPGLSLPDVWLQVPPALQHWSPANVCQLRPAGVSAPEKYRQGQRLFILQPSLGPLCTCSHAYSMCKLSRSLQGYRTDSFIYQGCEGIMQTMGKLPESPLGMQALAVALYSCQNRHKNKTGLSPFSLVRPCGLADSMWWRCAPE